MGGKHAARPAIRTPGNFRRHAAVWAMFFPPSGGLVSIRPIKRVVQSQPTLEGAGVKLRRAFGFGNTGDFDPFLLLDDFRNEHPQDYLAGFPWHPHRGIETITYVLAGSVAHGDSLGNRGTLGSGDVQWMTAGTRELTGNRSLVLFDSGDEITVQAGEDGIRFLLVSGRPIAEPVAWQGPIVMNTDAELRRAYAELRDGTFIKQR